MRILLLGGTGEARELAHQLDDHEVVSSLAGRTKDLRLPDGDVRVGGFGGVEGLASWLRQRAIDAVIDATHPFAAAMTEHAVAASRAAGVPLLILRRPGWTEQPGDDWHWVDDAQAAAAALPALGSRVFLTIGRQGLNHFAATGLWTLARCVDPPDPAPAWCTLLLDRGPYAVPGELELLRRHRIDVLVTKDSGGPQTEAKLTAARELQLPVVLIRRPELPTGVEAVGSVAAVAAWVRSARPSQSDARRVVPRAVPPDRRL
ncbi:cobalt-precorrin-6A reductase [Kribbella sandramycini]|uniref:Cobalt-precorrin-6A reductase n=1 Tax=Kribbella sandramycini TaxID=60450 RepID=A0A7Y4P232_9ACTN|nr:cobalt-precorrin-6A reductase [Kribbella sandramycini]MBB6571028.1 precorrin-6A/cobalt-precorrin-6A reductase [Kribbella sandramycini]NOL43563.1 cobalt-precorrin-6A reductase [Kribbella sandramycini]